MMAPGFLVADDLEAPPPTKPVRKETLGPGSPMVVRRLWPSGGQK